MNKDGLPFCFPEFIFLLLKQIFILLLMPANRNALIRYKTIDNCLRNPYRRWTLEDLVDACSDALYEYEGIDKGISKRTAQMDIQMMRSEKLGYNAPIVVYENKYYKYEDPEYSITQTPLNEQDLTTLCEMSQKEKITVILSGVNEKVHKVLEKSGFYELLGEENICPNINVALDRAKEIVE